MNIASKLVEMAKLYPEKIAVTYSKRRKSTSDISYNYQSISFKELEIKSNQFANALVSLGAKPNQLCLLFLRPSLDFHAMVFALFKIGIIPVLIDPGMGKKNLLKCISDIKPEIMIAEREVHLLSFIFRSKFKNIKIRISNKHIPFLKIKTIHQLKSEKLLLYTPIKREADDLAALLFTSGGTGTPKGVEYTHNIFLTQTNSLKEMFGLTPDEIDMAGFPLFSLFTLAMGMSTIIPDLDPTRPGDCDPARVCKNIIDKKPTFVAGSPAIWDKVLNYAASKNIKFDSIKYLVMFGAPVSLKIHRISEKVLTNGTTYTPYGATECLPVCNISGKYILQNTAKLSEDGKGTCIGFQVPGVRVLIIRETNAAIANLKDAEILSPNTPGEIIVKGPMVTRRYYNEDEKTKLSKIYEENGEFWHRIGDVGYIDELNRLWFLGRQSHVVKIKNDIYYPIPCEAIFNLHPEVKRSALVGINKFKKEYPAIVIERLDGEFLREKERSKFESELLVMSKKFPHTKNIEKIYLAKEFPVDVRHNIKIDRLKLKAEIENNEIE